VTREEMLAIIAEEQYNNGAVELMNRWLARGDGIAVYRNQDLGHPELGHRQLVSFGSPAAQIEQAEAPTKMPDIGNAINWRYQLEGTYRGEAL
jgi:hypothetical protein